MTSREQFEAWFQQKYKVTSDTMKVMQIKVELAWESWKASREAVEVDIPPALADDEYFIDGIFQPMRYERDVERAVIRAGLKIKGD